MDLKNYEMTPLLQLSTISSLQNWSIDPYSLYFAVFDFSNLLENQGFWLDSSAPLPREIIINQLQSQHFCPRYTFFL